MRSIVLQLIKFETLQVTMNSNNSNKNAFNPNLEPPIVLRNGRPYLLVFAVESTRWQKCSSGIRSICLLLVE